MTTSLDFVSHARRDVEHFYQECLFGARVWDCAALHLGCAPALPQQPRRTRDHQDTAEHRDR
jgi:hypothetical protein